MSNEHLWLENLAAQWQRDADGKCRRVAEKVKEACAGEVATMPDLPECGIERKELLIRIADLDLDKLLEEE